MEVHNQRGVLASVAATIAEADANIGHVLTNDRDGMMSTLTMSIEVRDRKHLADIIATHCCGWATVAKFPMENEVVNSYVARMRERPAYQRTSALG